MGQRRKRELRGERPARQRDRRRGTSGGDLGWALGLTLLAWVHRLAFLFSNQDRSWPFTIFYEGDAEARSPGSPTWTGTSRFLWSR